jgi:hypothetical protein
MASLPIQIVKGQPKLKGIGRPPLPPPSPTPVLAAKPASAPTPTLMPVTLALLHESFRR